MGYGDRARYKSRSRDKDTLQASLKTGEDKAWYTKALADAGYTITSVNADKANYVEYEVVKGSNSCEVQIDFDAGKAKKVDVITNLRQTEATEHALATDEK